MSVQEKKKGFDLLALINQVSEKMLGQPLMGAREEEVDPLQQGYTPDRHMPSYPSQIQQSYYPLQMPQQPMQSQQMQYSSQMQYPSQGYYPQGQYYAQNQQPYYPQQISQQPMQGQQMQYPSQGYYQQPHSQQPYYPPMQHPQQSMQGQQNGHHHQE